MKLYATLSAVALGTVILSYGVLPQLTAVKYSNTLVEEKRETKEIISDAPVAQPPVDTREVIQHVPLPIPLRAIYMTSCVAGTVDFRNSLIKLIDETEINAVVIDIKDFSGTISFPAQSSEWKSAWDEAPC